ncbi:VOC family protein [Aurantimonas sp. A2-1-M11]|uniref:VOC family protein n=1 Tax=Aurantimonas sp. A2-1-M11 TaxID=3113712 RepID=UPI002F941551
MRAIDHLVLPFADLAAARQRLAALGFTVAPDAAHPFGTGNACVFFADGIYLEPLAVVDRDAQARALADGNLFVARDAALRSAYPLPAISALALQSPDATGDRERLAAQGLADLGLVEFARPFRRDDGTADELSFRLTFARTLPGFAGTLFFCQKLHVSAPDRSVLTRHANGAEGLARIVLAGDMPSDARQLLEAAAGETIGQGTDGIERLAFGTAELEILPAAHAASRYGMAVTGAELCFAGIVLSVAYIARTRAALGPLAATDTDGRIVVPLGADGSPFIAFEETYP